MVNVTLVSQNAQFLAVSAYDSTGNLTHVEIQAGNS